MIDPKHFPTIPIPTCIALAVGLFGCAVFGLDPATDEDVDPAVEQASAPEPGEPSTSDAHFHADSGPSLIERVPGDTFTLASISRDSVEFTMLPLLLGPEREVLEVGELIEGTLRPGEEFTFDASFGVPDGYYTVDFALRVSGVGPDGERVQDEAQVEWPVRVADRRATTADHHEWLAAIMHEQGPQRR